MTFLTKLMGDPNARVIKTFSPIIDRVNALEKDIQSLSDEALRQRVEQRRADINGRADQTEAVIPDVFACVREAARRAIGQRHYDVQLVGGLVLHQGKIAEMKTGEGKTLVATLPVALNALVGKGVHVVTVNDYLAKRDTGWMGAIYHRLGLSCAAIVHETAFLFDPTFTDEQASDPLLIHLRPITRREAYQADITYGTNNEFGFDYLRDNMVPGVKHLVQRELHYAIVDEVDSILIDEARTPLIISAPVERSADEYRKIDTLVKQLAEDEHFKVDEKAHSAFLTENGIARMEQLLGVKNLYVSGGGDLLNIISQALKANSRLFERDKQYVVREGEIVIVDEFTGRLMFGRRYSEGLHQAIEAKEGVEVQQESQTLATITFQNLFRMYAKLAGMTGTAATEAEEFHKIYNLDVVQIPTNRPMVRKDAEDRVYKNEVGKYQAVVREIKERHERGQPVLVGTISIAKNELLSQLLEQEGIAHEVLNAKNHEREAAIIAQAGRRQAVTIATNMAGRGVDIILGGNPPNPQEHQGVVGLGGLHVIGTERHESRRIDLQLRGRAGRQGDPGSSQFFVSMEDDLMRIFGSDRMKGLMERLGVPDDVPIENRLVSRSIESAQKKVEGHNFDIRKHLVEYDDVMNKHRDVIYRKRREVLTAPLDQLRELILGILEQEIDRLVAYHSTPNENTAWDLNALYDAVGAIIPLLPEDRLPIAKLPLTTNVTNGDVVRRDVVAHHVMSIAEQRLTQLEQSIHDPDLIAQLFRSVILRAIDTLWIEHLELMERLREGIGLRGYGQRDPLVEYKREAFQLFSQLMNAINEQVSATIFRIGEVRRPESTPMASKRLIESAPAKTMEETPDSGAVGAAAPASRSATVVPNELRDVGRNDPCPCGSGRKFKKCYLAKHPDCKLLSRA